MNFEDDLLKKIAEYTDFTLFGNKFQIPYQLGGKKTPSEITRILMSIFHFEASPADIIARLYKKDSRGKRDLGVDCSGFAYYVLNEASNGALKEIFNVSYTYGVSARNLTSLKYGIKIFRAGDIKPGCIIRTDGGAHIIVIYGVVQNNMGKIVRINYAHSSGSIGPHKGYIDISDPNKDLNAVEQTWFDSAYTDAVAKNYYDYTVKMSCIP